MIKRALVALAIMALIASLSLNAYFYRKHSQTTVGLKSEDRSRTQNSSGTNSPLVRQPKSMGRKAIDGPDTKPSKGSDGDAPAGPARSELRTRIIAAIFPQRGVDADDILYTDQAMQEMLVMLTEEKDDSIIAHVLGALQYFAVIGRLLTTPGEVFGFAKSTNGAVSSNALILMARIGDESAVKALVGFLGEGKAGPPSVTTWGALRASAFSRDGRVSQAVLPYLSTATDVNSLGLALNSVGITDFTSYEDRIERLEGDHRAGGVWPLAKLAHQRLDILTAADRDQKLLECVQGMRMSGEFSWYNWGLEQIVRLNLKQHAVALRAIYDEGQARWKLTGPESFKMRLLSAIYTLGGVLTREECELLRRIGRAQ